MNRADYGQVPVTIGDEEMTMKPTLKAYNSIDARFGGLRSALESCATMNISGLSFIVAAGCGIGQREAKDLPEKIFSAGAINLLPKVTEYLMLLMNPTGKDAVDDDDSEGDSEGEA